MPLINCKIELKLKSTNNCILSTAGADNGNANSSNFIFTIKNTKLYVHVVTWSARENKKLSKPLSKGFERSVYWNKHKTKSENKKMTNEYRYFLESNFVLVYSNQDDNSKRFKAKRYLPKRIINNYNVTMNGKNFYDQTIDSHIKQYEEIRKLTTGRPRGRLH